MGVPWGAHLGARGLPNLMAPEISVLKSGEGLPQKRHGLNACVVNKRPIGRQKAKGPWVAVRMGRAGDKGNHLRCKWAKSKNAPAMS